MTKQPARSHRSYMAALGGVAAVVYPGVTWGHFDSWVNWVTGYLFVVSLAALWGYAGFVHEAMVGRRANKRRVNRARPEWRP